MRKKLDTPTPTLSKRGLLEPPAKGPAVLFYDIETTPALAWVWSAYDTNIIDMHTGWRLLSFSYKWKGKAQVDFARVYKLDDTGAVDDQFIAEHLHALFDRADIIVAHNGDRFDRKKSNARFAAHGLTQPAPYQTVDTLKMARRNLSLMKNNLAEVAKFFGIEQGKVSHPGFEMWLGCMNFEAKWWKLMERYNRQDVKLLEKVYDKLLPFAAAPGQGGMPNLGVYADRFACKICEHTKGEKRGFHYTNAGKYQTWRCHKCGSYSRFMRREPQSEGVMR